MSMSSTPWKLEARHLLAELNEFATAADALSLLFAALGGDAAAPGVRLLRRLLTWQSLAQSALPLRAVVAHFDTHEDSEQAAAAAEEEEGIALNLQQPVMLLVMGKPALLFATSIYDEELALLVWRGLVRFQQLLPQSSPLALAPQVFDNTHDSHGFCSLHYAIEAQMDEFMQQVAQDLLAAEVSSAASSTLYDVAQLCQRVTTQDVVLPMGKNQIQGKNIASGGCTLLHLAAKKGELNIVKLLVAPPFCLDASGEDGGGALEQRDFDGNTPLQLALLHGRSDVAVFLQTFSHSQAPESSSTALQALRETRDACAKERYIASLDAQPSMLQAQKFPAIWSLDECQQVLGELDKVTDDQGWCTQRHAAYPTTDMPCYRVVPIEAWVRGSLIKRLFTQLHERYAIPIATKQIAFRELFYVKYEARNGERAELGIHCDGSVLSFNILLNDASEFTGGGTFFEASGETIHITQGDAVVHSGKVRHAGAPVLSGKRLIIVGFLDIVDRVF